MPACRPSGSVRRRSACERCGREGHAGRACWFLTYVDGRTIGAPSFPGDGGALPDALAGLALPKVLERLIGCIAVLARSHTTFYIGRSYDPDARCEQHGAPKHTKLYSSGNKNHIMWLEEELIENFFDHWKNDNISTESLGNFSRQNPINHIYVALWP